MLSHPSPSLSPTDPVPRGLLTLWAGFSGTRTRCRWSRAKESLGSNTRPRMPALPPTLCPLCTLCLLPRMCIKKDAGGRQGADDADDDSGREQTVLMMMEGGRRRCWPGIHAWHEPAASFRSPYASISICIHTTEVMGQWARGTGSVGDSVGEGHAGEGVQGGGRR